MHDAGGPEFGGTYLGGIMRTNFTLNSIALVASTLVTSAALAGPEFDEGGKDAGSLASTASTVSATANTPVTRVRGATSSTAFVGAPDLVDMYLVKCGSNPYDFKVDMNMIAGAAPAWAARLTLFKKMVVNCGGPAAPVWVTIAVPVATVVKASANVSYAILNGNALLVGSTSQRLGDLMVANSEYFVAVSGATNLPMGIQGFCENGTTNQLFAQATGTGIYPASQSESGSRLSGWMSPAGSATGVCDMVTSGVYPLPASGCDIAVRVTGSPVTKAFDFAFAPAASGTVPCAPGYTVSREFFYEWTAPCTGDAVITTCGLTTVDTGIEVFAIDSCAGDACSAAAGTAVACNDQCGTGNASAVNFAATSGTTYLVRLTRLSGNATTGSIKFTCEGAPASADLNGDGVVNSVDLASLLTRWGTNGN